MSPIGITTLIILTTILDTVLSVPHTYLRKKGYPQKFDHPQPHAVKPPKRYPPSRDAASPGPRDIENRWDPVTRTPTPAWLAGTPDMGLQIDRLWEALTGHFSSEPANTGEPATGEPATETPSENSFGNSKCCAYCNFMNVDPDLSKIIAIAIEKGLMREEESRGCLDLCKARKCSIFSHSTSPITENVPTFPPDREQRIEIVTGAVQEEMLVRGRQHCYQTLRPRTVTAEDRSLCHYRYRPTREGPRPSYRPPGQNVWTCCRDISNNSNDYG